MARESDQRIAVLMPIYPGLRPEYFQESLDSIIGQDGTDFTVFIHAYGIIAPPILEYIARFPGIVRIVWSEEYTNMSGALNKLIDHILQDRSYKLLARMDADDIALRGRFKKQIAYLEAHPEVSVVGGWIEEFYEGSDTAHLKKTAVEPTEIRRIFVCRCAMNHPTVMFRRNVFESGFRYVAGLITFKDSSNVTRMEDVILWSKLLAADHRLGNLAEPVLRFRMDSTFFTRRRGLTMAINEFKVRWTAMRMLNDWSIHNVCGVCALFVMRLAPATVLRYLYLTFR